MRKKTKNRHGRQLVNHSRYGHHREVREKSLTSE